ERGAASVRSAGALVQYDVEAWGFRVGPVATTLRNSMKVLLQRTAGPYIRVNNHQPLMVDARLHPADVIAHDEEDVGLLLLLGGCRRGRHRGGDNDIKYEGSSWLLQLLPSHLLA